MRILNLDGRLSLAVDDGAVDVETASGGRFSADVMSVYERWEEFLTWARQYRRRHGLWPTRNSGLLDGVPGETWAMVDRALRNRLGVVEELGEVDIGNRTAAFAARTHAAGEAEGSSLGLAFTAFDRDRAGPRTEGMLKENA